MHVLENSVVHLEPQRATHAEAMFKVLSDPAIYEHENEPPPSVEWLRSRFSRLESRVSPDGTERWLNWVIRLPSSELIGYVQATVDASHRAAIAYQLSSQYWGQGLATAAVQLMVEELAATYHVKVLSAVLKRTNLRSRKLLERLGFTLVPPEQSQAYAIDSDEVCLLREAVL